MYFGGQFGGRDTGKDRWHHDVLAMSKRKQLPTFRRSKCKIVM
jgi:hypothetical protein